jgi:putative ABC transport system permease protein
MYKDYFKITLRNLIRRKTFSLINILGLAFGIAACIIIYIYVSYEKSYDTFNLNADNIYRLKNVRFYKSGTDSTAGCVALLGPTIKEEIPGVIDFARLRKISALVSANNQYFNEKNIFWADSSFLKMFSFPLISGDAGKALNKKYSAVLAKSTAQKYFSNENPINKIIKIDGNDYTVTGISENVPPNSHIKFDILLSFNTQLTDRFCWGCNNNNTYIQVSPGIKKSDVEAKLPLIVKKLHNRQKDGFERAYFLQPLKDIHLYSHLRSEHEENGNAKTIYFLSFTALLILLIAWINYINLSTARSIERAKEVGVRKVVGAGFWSLIRQFLFESFITNILALFISIIIIELTLPYWNKLTGMPASFSFWGNGNPVIFMIILLLSPFISGIYPALVLSSYSPALILKGDFKSSFKGIILRKGLVIFQFTISIILIAIIIVFSTQISFMRNKNLGFDIKQKLVVNSPFKIEEGKDKASLSNTFINELRTQSLIEDATFTSVIPGMENNWVSGGVRHDNQSIEQGKQAYFGYVAQNYLNFFRIDLVCGRNFFKSELGKLYQDISIPKTLILNESAVNEFGFNTPEEALGAAIYNDNFKVGTVIGVIKDYHQQSLDKEIEPLILGGATTGEYFIFDINTKNISNKIDGIKNNFKKIFPGNPFEYYFLDEFFDRQYRSDIKTTQIFSLFTFLSIFISCLGLIGLSSLMITHRTKEIGIRKVLGASIQSLLTLLSKEFLKWVLIANFIACPIAYYFMNKWLQGFAYRIEISWWVFVLSGGISLVIALVTVSLQAIKASTANPVESLKYE